MVLSDNMSYVASIADLQLTNGLTNSPEKELAKAVRESSPSKADSFSAALTMIASLPLSVAEKAEAVRRLMAGQEGVKP